MTPEQRSHRILAAIRVVAKLQTHLEKTDARMRGAETKELGDATKAYREIVRDADERRDSLTPEESHSILPQVCDGLRARDAIHEAITLARKNRTNERKRVAAALTELHLPDHTDGDQVELPLTGPTKDDDATGLGHFTSEARSIVYTALLAGDERHELDAAQVDLLAELASMDLEQVDLVLDAADAIDDETDALEDDDLADLDHETASDSLPV